MLRRKGILYPHNLEKLKNTSAPKHQWIERNLLTAHWEYFLENLKNVVSQVDTNTHTIILSSEGIYNSWWDLPEQSKSVLGELAKIFEVEVWVWFREPLSFAESYYKQCIRNPAIEGNPCYGKDLSFSDMLDIEWFSRHLNYQGFVDECQAIFGEHNVSVFEYKGDVVQAVVQRLGLATLHDNPTPRKNDSLHSSSIGLLRVINQYGIKTKDKELLMPHLRSMNEVFDDYSNESVVDDESRERVLKLSCPVTF